MKSFFRRIWLSKEHIATTAGKWTAALYALGGFISLLVSFEGLLCDSVTFWYKLLISAAVLVGIWLLCAIVVAIYTDARPKRKW